MPTHKLLTGIYNLKQNQTELIITVLYSQQEFSIEVVLEGKPNDLQELISYANAFAKEVITGKSTRNFYDTKYLNSN